MQIWELPACPRLYYALVSFMTSFFYFIQLKHLEADGTTDEKSDSAKLTLQDESYVVVGTIFVLIPLLFDYLHLGEQFAPWSPLLRDIQTNLSKFLNVCDTITEKHWYCPKIKFKNKEFLNSPVISSSPDLKKQLRSLLFSSSSFSTPVAAAWCWVRKLVNEAS